MLDICEFSYEELSKWLQENGEKSFRASQILEWIFEKRVKSFSEMTTLSKNLRESLEKKFQLFGMELVQIENSQDEQTKKFLWRLHDRRLVESVLIYSGDRRTLCVSSQVGCPAKCAFCASGKKGLMRNLKASEIIDQLFLVNQTLKKDGEKVSHIVFMGMGEPLENYAAVKKAVEIFVSEKHFNLSQRRITISTVGVIEGIERLIQEKFRVNLVLSLHAPNDHIRKKIIPYARKYSLSEIFSSLDRYFNKTKREITYEYILIHGINDKEEHAIELSELLKDKKCTVNLIPYNPVQGLRLKRPEKETIYDFMGILEKNGINTTWRYTKGKDIEAACGQLALKEE